MTERQEVLLDVLSSLVAAVSLLKRSPKIGAASNRMFDQMIVDYERSIERARAYLAQKT